MTDIPTPAEAATTPALRHFRGTVIGILPRAREFEARLHDGRYIAGPDDITVADIIDFKARFEGVETLLALLPDALHDDEHFVLTGAAKHPTSAANEETSP